MYRTKRSVVCLGIVVRTMNLNHHILSYFPLGVFLLPGEDIPLRIFEPKYIQLIDECKETGLTFAIPFVLDDQIQDYGCEVKLQQVVAENPSGRMVVTIEGISLVKIQSFNERMDGKLYAGGEVSFLPEPNIVKDPTLIVLVMNYIEHFDNTFLDSTDEEQSLNFHDLLVALNLSSEEKYKFIIMKDIKQKEQFLIKQINYLKLIRNQEQLLDNEFGLN